MGHGHLYYIQLHEDEEECMKSLTKVIDLWVDSSDEEANNIAPPAQILEICT